MTQKNNIGILLSNIGTPDNPTPSAVRRYLKEFLSDKRIVEIPRAIWWPILHGFILRFRPKKSASLYQQIWTAQGSPLLTHSRQLAEALEKKLNLPVALGMHYGNPSIQSALEALRKKNINKLFILPLYPQYSATTTATTVDKTAHVLKKWRNIPEIHLINDYADNTNYINSISQSIYTAWTQQGRADYLLFSFHGIPKRYSDAGDPYQERCKTTVELIAKELNLRPDEYSLAFQSRLGRAAWLQPYTDHMLKSLPQKGIKHLQVVCPGFAVDCLETLEEIAMRGKKQFLENGGKVFNYIPALNNSDAHIETFANIIKQNIKI
ncbi:MAG: hypothetical protein ACD_45C00325G0002 [uncultured bacterium]|nr:MAG: hypothetical protein ACD_45C00325G0002 [uncultured bacterium]